MHLSFLLKNSCTIEYYSEQKARAMYEHLMDITNDSEILAPLSFLRQREIIHFNRFKEMLEKLKKEIGQK